MVKKRRQYSDEFRDQVVARLRAGANVRHLSWELDMPKSVLFSWREKGERYLSEEQRKDREITQLQTQVRDLEAAVGRKSLEVDFLASALRRVGVKIPSNRKSGRRTSGPRSGAGWSRKAD